MAKKKTKRSNKGIIKKSIKKAKKVHPFFDDANSQLLILIAILFSGEIFHLMIRVMVSIEVNYVKLVALLIVLFCIVLEIRKNILKWK